MLISHQGIASQVLKDHPNKACKRDNYCVVFEGFEAQTKQTAPPVVGFEWVQWMFTVSKFDSKSLCFADSCRAAVKKSA